MKHDKDKSPARRPSSVSADHVKALGNNILPNNSLIKEEREEDDVSGDSSPGGGKRTEMQKNATNNFTSMKGRQS